MQYNAPSYQVNGFNPRSTNAPLYYTTFQVNGNSL